MEFKTGIYYLALKEPSVEYIPVYIENLTRILPKGEFLPVPLISHLTFGEPFSINSNETKDTFIKRARDRIVKLVPLNEEG